MADVRIDKLAGKSLFYDRVTQADYGVGGVPYRPYVNPNFAHECDDCFSELISDLSQHAGLKVETILTGGVSRSGSGSSYHHQNRAFDLDGLLFEGGSNWVATSFPQRPLLYLGMEAILRRHFGTILSYDYNRAHQDHFHFDNGTSIGLKTAAKSHVIFLQNVLVFVYQQNIGRDGVWGPNTNAAVRGVREAMNIGGLSQLQNWRTFLKQVAKDAFELEKARIGGPVLPDPEVCHCCGQILD